MSVVLNTNIASLMASNNLLNAQSSLATSVQRLSSGLRINSAADDAAGLGVANSLTEQINGADQGVRNLNDGISMTQTAEGAIAAASDMGQQIITLATQGANATLGSDQRAAIKSQMLQLISSIDSIGGRTNFSGNPLLNVSTSAAVNGNYYSMQTSNSATDKVSLSSNAFLSIGSGINGNSGGVLVFENGSTGSVTDLTPQASLVTSGSATPYSLAFSALKAGESVSVTQGSNTEVFTASQDLTAQQVASNFVANASVSGGTMSGNSITGATSAANGVASFAAADTATVSNAPTVTVTAKTTTSNEVNSVQFQDAHSGEKITVAGVSFTLTSDASASQIANAFYQYITGATSSNLGTFSGTLTSGWSVDAYGNGQATNLLNAINAINPNDTAANTTAQFQAVQTAANNYVTALTTQRSLLGAYDNQMNYTLSNITTLSSNLQAARSRVQDVDYASETAKLTKGQILQQAATAMLAQANQMPNVILTLLK